MPEPDLEAVSHWHWDHTFGMDTTEGYFILDARTQEEYDRSHIPGVVMIPHTDIGERAATELLDQNQMILVYCCSGNCSKQASKVLTEFGIY